MTSTRPQLSVIVPCHRLAGEPARGMFWTMIGSLGRACPAGSQIILVDDGSGDGTDALLAEVKLPGLDVEVLPLPHNRGLAGARNAGLDHATGTWLSFVDADDWVARDHWTSLVDYAQRLDVAMLRSDHVQVSGRDRSIVRMTGTARGRVGCPREDILPAARATGVDLPWAWAGLYHRRLLEAGLLHFDEGLRTAEDRPWIWRLYLGADSYSVPPQLGHFYRRDLSGSLSRTGDERQLDTVPALRTLVQVAAADRQADRWGLKATRTVLSQLGHHWQHRGRLAPGLATRLRHDARHLVGELDQGLVRQAYAGLADHRRHQVRGLLGGQP
ncbi:glycosyltransferase family 2 protein [Parenemella sanctibonifatiensis]|uniref:Glycosyl transferase n=1 Tax=Parenemella sanctibonifatiensis TaxID=2016505 RepID=A0A255EIE3_9ACTN|nr:glycosyltransferase family 2 protein [Parenemella sanctibonifatiensis]OYN91010.1 glycosyl transferase [Parenemella sanctibonifatiensis]